MTNEQKIQHLRHELLEARKEIWKLNNLLGHKNDETTALLKHIKTYEQWFKDREIIMKSYELPYLWIVRKDLATLTGTTTYTPDNPHDYREEEDLLIETE